MTVNAETTKTQAQRSSGRRLLRAMLCIGHPKLKPWMCWIFFIPQFVLYLYWLGPVFVYYFEGVPPEASLETITGVWREEGKMGANDDGLTAPRYFVDTKSGPREVHCGFPVQQRFCGLSMGSEVLRPGDKVTVHYDPYFGILGFEKLNPGDTARMTYQDAVYIYARSKYTTKWNHKAALRLFMLLGFYVVAVLACWSADGRPASAEAAEDHGMSNMKNLLLTATAWFALATTAHGASFDCEKARSKVEHLICGNPELSQLDVKLDQDYRDVLNKADDHQKHPVLVEQRHWKKLTRDVCNTTACLKLAYWSRQAELEMYFEPKSPLYKDESDKAAAIQKVLTTAPLYEATLSDPKLCRQVFADLKAMNGVRFVAPVVQTQSYEDPALDSWKQSCSSGQQLNVNYTCEPNIAPDDTDGDLQLCAVGFGLPPFKIYDLEPLTPADKERYIYYADDSYGPMNEEWQTPVRGMGGFAGFREFKTGQCDGFAGGSYEQVRAEQATGANYNSIIIYRQQYFFLVVENKLGSYWLSIDPIDHRGICRWSPVGSSSRDTGVSNLFGAIC